jgi:hypothetical protein
VSSTILNPFHPAPHQTHSFQRIGSLIHYLIFSPLDIAVVSACGVRQTGPSFLIGVAVLLLLIPTQALLANALQRAGKRASVLTGACVGIKSVGRCCRF